MGYTTIFNGVIFIEGHMDNVKVISEISSDLSFKFGAQLKNLRDVKLDLSNKAKQLKANCIINFTYGQKSRWLAIDDVAFWGKGYAVSMSNEDYENVVQKLNVN